MRSLVTSLVLCLSVGGIGYAQNFVKATDDPFNGVWKVDWSKSRYIDELKSRKSSPDAKGPLGVKEEVVTLTIKNNTEHCINDLTFEDGHRSQSEYTATYNDGQWYPNISSKTKKPTGGSVQLLRLEPGRELRISRGANGVVNSLILRTVQPDGTMRTINMGTDGVRRTDITLINQAAKKQGTR